MALGVSRRYRVAAGSARCYKIPYARLDAGAKRHTVVAGAALNREACISSGNCVADSPNAFDFDDDDIAIVKDGVAELPDDRLLRVARNCPAGAIILRDDDGNEVALFG